MLEKQLSLEYLDLHSCEFSGDQTEILLKTITKSKMLSSLTTLDIHQSANFSTDKSVSYLAKILAKAKNLKLVDITSQIGNRKIDVEVSEEREWLSTNGHECDRFGSQSTYPEGRP